MLDFRDCSIGLHSADAQHDLPTKQIASRRNIMTQQVSRRIQLPDLWTWNFPGTQVETHRADADRSVVGCGIGQCGDAADDDKHLNTTLSTRSGYMVRYSLHFCYLVGSLP